MDGVIELLDVYIVEEAKKILPKIIMDANTLGSSNLIAFDFDHFCNNGYHYCAYNPFEKSVYMLYIDDEETDYTIILLDDNCEECKKSLEGKSYLYIVDWKDEFILNFTKLSALNQYLALLPIHPEYIEWIKKNY